MTPEIAVVGAGYVGVPLADVFAAAGKNVVLVDVDPGRVAQLNAGSSYIKDVSSERIAEHVSAGHLTATTDYDVLREAEAILVALPTPLSKQREPDLAIVESAVREISTRLRKGHVVVLESTTYPGTTRELVQPILEEGSGLKVGTDFHLAFSPERVDPGREDFTTKTTPKVIGGVTPACTKAAAAVYGSAVDRVVEVSSPEAAELTKLLENIFRSVNIALVNELARLCSRMKIDIWEVIDAAATKPFGFMSFKPGPGLGGHCIPIDPFYLTWKAREFGVATRFIELAGEVNQVMPDYVVGMLADALDRRFAKGLNGARILILGLAYKKNVDDIRESPAFRLIELLHERQAEVAYYDPYVPVIPRTREHAALAGIRSIKWSPRSFARYDAVLICTDHDKVDYDAAVRHAKLVVDSRNATKAVKSGRERIILA
jgi:UDP-N-acetyl-D-glucosamine dehydrogenase